MLWMVDDIQHSLIIKATDIVVAGGAITYPLWRQALHDWSALASEITPMVGVAWLGVQIISKIWVTWFRRLP